MLDPSDANGWLRRSIHTLGRFPFILEVFITTPSVLFLSCETPPVIYDAELKGRQLDSLIQDLTRKINADPSDANSLEELGRTYLQRADYQIKKTCMRVDAYWGTNRDTMKYFITEARRCYEKTLQVRPNSATGYIGLGNCYRIIYQPYERSMPNEGRYFSLPGPDSRQILELYTTIRSYYKRATEIQPDMADAWFYLYSTGPQKEMLDKVLSIDKYHLKASTERYQFSSIHEINKNVLNNLNALYPLAKKTEDIDIDALRFCEVYKDKQEDIFKESISHVPNFVKSFVWLPYQKLVYSREGNLVHRIKKFYKMEPYNSHLLSWLCHCDQSPSKLTNYYRELIRITNYAIHEYPWYPIEKLPRSYWDYLTYGSSYWEWNAKAGEYSLNADTSRVYFNKAITLDSCRAIGYYLLASLQYQMGEISKAEANLSLTAQIQPSDRFARVCANELLALLYLRRGDLQKAMRTFETAMRIDSAHVKYSLSWGLYGWQEIPFYTDTINSFLKNTGKKEKAFLAWMCLANGHSAFRSMQSSDSIPNYVKAYQWFKKALELDPQNIEVYEPLSYLFDFYLDGSKEEAYKFKKAIQKALKVYPSNTELWLYLALITSRDYSGSEALGYVEKASSLGSYYAKEILERKKVTEK